MKTAITEKDNIHEEWYKEANSGMTLEKLTEFMRKLSEDYRHDYGTICHALAAAGIAAMCAMDNTKQGGITGFQAGAIIWEVINHWGAFEDGPKRMMCYHTMLYPQHEADFEKTISPTTWEYLQKKAKEFLGETSTNGTAEARKHWQSIVDGKVPFGYTIREV